ncbi:MAG: adenine phosphoribosyltransferase [Firmicutes bacterium]|nr:adenine phosphoribosyltransferase [Bacillota bacterium]
MNKTSVEAYLKEKIRDLNDWPKEGVIFRDITPVLADPEAFGTTIDAMEDALKDIEFSKIAAVESRGFIFGATLANKMKKGFIPVRKPGKLPYKTISESYALEYGTDTIHMHIDAVQEGDKVVIIDDLIATGGSSKAAATLVEKLGGKVTSLVFLIELEFLNGREKLQGYEVKSIVKY